MADESLGFEANESDTDVVNPEVSEANAADDEQDVEVETDGEEEEL